MSDYDVFVDNEEEKVTEETVTQSTKKDKIPSDYLKVKLPTLGKLDAPYTIHVKDYSGEDALNLSLMNEDNVLNVITTVADNIIYEGIDSNYLHEQELQVIMLHIYYNYWGSAITDYPYPYEEEELSELPEERQKNIRNNKEVPRIDVPIKNISTNPLPDEFKEPFVLTDTNGKKVTFTLARLGHIKKAQDYIEKKYAQEEQKYGYIKQLIAEKSSEEVLKEIPYSEIKAYNSYLEKRSLDFAKVQQCQVIQKIGAKKFDTLEGKINAYSEIGLHTWRMYSDFVKSLNFGVSPEVEVKSPLTGQTVTRRFLFRFMDFIPSVESQEPAGYTISYEE